jgi:hypothetical protein
VSTRRWPLLALAALSYAAAGFASAEDLDVAKLLDEAKAAHAGKHYGKSLQSLSLAMNEVSRLRLDGLKSVFPTVEGWQGDEVEGQSNLGALMGAGAGFATLKRTYTKGETSVDVELMIDAPAIFSQFQMMIGGGFTPQGTQVIMVKGRKAALRLEKEQKSGELQILLAGNSVMTLRGRQVAKADLVDTIGGAFDMDALEKAIAD